MGKPRIIYTPRSGATPEGELDALASIYAFVLQKYQERRQATEHVPTLDGCDDHKWLVSEKRRLR